MRRIWIIPSTKQEIIDKHTPVIKGLKTKKARGVETNVMISEIKEAQLKAVEAALVDADSNNCNEIAWGVPPVLILKLEGKELPRVYEEPEQPPSPEPRDLGAEIDMLKSKVDALEKEKK